MSQQSLAEIVRKNSSPRSVAGTIQRKCEKCKKKKQPLQRRSAGRTEPSHVPHIVHDVLRSPGAQLDKSTRSFMEGRFGHNFGDVMVHADAKAAESAEAVNAMAYAVGKDIVFGPGRYTPNTSAGLKLLAHEITHTIQQEPGKSPEVKLSPPNSPLEEEADRSEAFALLPESGFRGALPVSRRSGVSLQGQFKDKGEGESPKKSTNPRGSTLPRQEALGSIDEMLMDEYRKNCEGAPQRLNRQLLPPAENVVRLEKLVRALPTLVEMQHHVLTEQPTDENIQTMKEQIKKFGFDENYRFNLLETEMAMARCELAEARLEESRATTGKKMPGSLLKAR